jgi:HTH-type transcriptional regulator/antitoxin HigA
MKSSRTPGTTNGIKKGRETSSNGAPEDYLEAVKKFPLKIITNSQQNEKALVRFEELIHASNRGKLSPGESDYMDVLSLLIRDYESTIHTFEKPEGREMVRFFMQQHELKQRDMVPHIFETQSIVSEVLNGKKKLTIDHIKRLADHFKVKAELFLD